VTFEQQADPSTRIARDAALGMLARREHSVFELRQKLAAKGYERELVEAVIGRLTESGLQSDARFAESFVRSRANRGLGPARIALELKQRGIGEELIEQHLDRNDPEWFEACAEVARAKFGRKPPKDLREKGQRARFLQYRGFTSAQINRCLKGGGEEDEEY
jgi:regulatory protein